jgi:hypothetical protein
LVKKIVTREEVTGAQMNLRSGSYAGVRRDGDAQMSVDFIDYHGSDAITVSVMSVTAA